MRLDLRLDPLGGFVQMEADPAGGASALGALAARYPFSERVAAGLVQVPLDDFLVGLPNLRSWPWPDEVEWESALRDLVEAVYSDAKMAEARLEGKAVNLTTVEFMAGLGDEWRAELTSFQIRDASVLATLRHGANFSVPGAGKTRVALAVFQFRRSRGEVERALVIAPKSAFDAWDSEALEVFGPGGLMVERWAGGPIPNADIVVTNYERLADGVSALETWLVSRPSMLILDEAHRMKRGQDGVFGAACLRLGPRACHRLILTGTPAPNGPRDLESLMGFVWPGVGRAKVRSAVAGADLRSASAALRPLFVRTRKADLGLPPVTVRRRRVPLPPLHAQIYQALVGSVRPTSASTGGDIQSLGRIVMYLLMAAVSPTFLTMGATRYEPVVYRVPPLDPPEGSPLAALLSDLPDYEISPKLAEAETIVRANAAEGKKTLVWSTFVRTLTTMSVMLDDLAPAVVYGGTVDRDTELRRFREDKDCFVLLSNPATLGEGVSLHHWCHEAVYIDRDFAAGRYLQSVDRIHRLGLAPDTETAVTVIEAEGTIDEVVALRLAAKVNFMEQVLDDPDLRELVDLDEEPSVAAGLDPSDVASLLVFLRDGTS